MNRPFRSALIGLLAALACVPAANAGGLPHVERSGERSFISDGQGRELLLRGINVNGLLEYPDYFRQEVPVTRADVREMGALGFNFLRLPINWSRLAPEPGHYSRAYLGEIDRIVRWAEDEGMRVVVDFHQDRYNRNLRPGDEADGAPDWATFTDGKPCEAAFFLSPCSQAAYDNFWANRVVAGKGLQDHYIDALLVVSRHLRHDRELLGLELMNEPTFGSVGSPDFERTQLWPFNRKAIAALRRDGERRMIWFGPSILRDVIDRDPANPERFSNDPNLVYAPHIYTGTFNSGGVPEMKQSIASAQDEASRYGAAWVDAEWGGGSGGTNETFRAQVLDELDAARVGSGFWMWKQRPGFYNWHTVELDGSLRDDSLRAQQLSRPHVDAVPGELLHTRVRGDGHLVAVVRGQGGVARFWSGTVVRRGGASLLPAALTRVRVDGRPARVLLDRKRFTTDSVSLSGYRVFVRLRPGTHLIEISAP